MVTERVFGNLPSGEEAHLYHIENKSGAYIEVSQYGAILVKVCVPDKDGRLTDVVLGYDDLESYFVNGCFFGACIGRSGNRIADSRFMLDGAEIKLTPNEGKNNLHSGPNGFEKKLWNASAVEGKNAVTFSRISPVMYSKTEVSKNEPQNKIKRFPFSGVKIATTSTTPHP